MAKVKIWESFVEKVGGAEPKPILREVEMETVDAREAVQHDPERWSYANPGAPKADVASPRYKVKHRGGGKYDVIDTTDKTVADGDMDKSAAEAKAAELEAKG